MGGKAAKERRRLKRLGALDEGISEANGPDMEKKKQKLPPSMIQKKAHEEGRSNLKKNGKFPKNAGGRGGVSHRQNNPNQKKKSKKPKHLKRKLEQLSSADGGGNNANAEEERARIEKQMKEHSFANIQDEAKHIAGPEKRR